MSLCFRSIDQVFEVGQLVIWRHYEDAEWNKAKRQWKEDNPDQSIKDWKQAFVSGRIHVLPWAPKKDEQQIA